MVPSWLWVPSTFQIFMGVSTGRYPILSRWRRFLDMKLSVAPESTRTSRSAIACADSNRTGIHIDRYLLLYMLIRNAFTQAARFTAMDLRWLTSLMGQLTGRISHNSWAADVGRHQRFFHNSWASRCRLRLEKLLRNYPEDPEIPDKCKGVHMY